MSRVANHNKVRHVTIKTTATIDPIIFFVSSRQPRRSKKGAACREQQQNVAYASGRQF